MLGLKTAGSQEAGLAAGLHLLDEVAGKGAVLDFLQLAAHGVPGLLGHDAGTGNVVAVLSSVGDGVAHTGQAALVDEVGDELHFMHAFKEGHLRMVAGFHQGLEAALDEGGDAAAEHALLAEEVGFGLFAEGGLNNAGTCAADALGVSQGVVLGLAGGILVHGDQIRHAAAFGEGTAHEVAGTLGGNHDDVHVLGADDLLEVDVEAVGKHQRVAGFQVGGNVRLVDVSLHFIGQKHHDHICLGTGFGSAHGLKAVLLGQIVVGSSGTLAYDHIDAGITKIEGMGMALAAVTQDSNCLVLEEGKIGIVVIIRFHGKNSCYNQH